MKFVLKQNNERMLQVYTSWASGRLGAEKVTNLQNDVSNATLLAELIYQTTGERIHDQLKNIPSAKVEDISTCLSLLRHKGCPLNDCTSQGLARGDLDSVLSLFYNLTRLEEKTKTEKLTNDKSKQNQPCMESETVSKIKPPKPLPVSNHRTMTRLPTSSGYRTVGRNSGQSAPAGQTPHDAKTRTPRNGFGFNKPIEKPNQPSAMPEKLPLKSKTARPRSTSSTSSKASNCSLSSSRLKQPVSRLAQPNGTSDKTASSTKHSQIRSKPAPPANSTKMAKANSKPSSAPDPPQRTTSRLSSERVRQDIPPELPKKSTTKTTRLNQPVNSQKPPKTAAEMGKESTTLRNQNGLSEINSRIKAPSRPKVTEKTRGSTGIRSVETTKIRPPSFLPQKSTSAAGVKAKSDIAPGVTKLKYVSVSGRQHAASEFDTRPAPPPPPQQSTTKIVKQLTDTKPGPKPVDSAKSVKTAVPTAPPMPTPSPPPPPQRTTSTSSAPSIEELTKPASIPSPSSNAKAPPASIPPTPTPPSPPPPAAPKLAKKSEVPEKKEKSKLASKLSKLSQMSPKFTRKPIRVAKSFMDDNSPKSLEKEKANKKSSLSLFSPKVPKKTVKPAEEKKSEMPEFDPQLAASDDIDKELIDEDNDVVIQLTIEKEQKTENVAKQLLRPNSLHLEKDRNPSLSSKISIIDLVNCEDLSEIKNRERTVSSGSSFLQSPMSPKSVDLVPTLSESKSFGSLSEIEDRPTTSSSSTISESGSKSFIRKSIDQNSLLDSTSGHRNSLRYSFPAQSESSMISTSTADETASQISLMRDSINQAISRTKSFEILKDEECSTQSPRQRPKSLFCSTSTPVRSHDRIPENPIATSPEETDPTLKAVKKAMQRSDFLQRLDKWETEEFSSAEDDVHTDDISVSSSSTSGSPSEMRKRREIGSSRVGERLAKNQPVSSTGGEAVTTSTVKKRMTVEPEKVDRPVSLMSTPPSSVKSENIHDRKLLPQRGQQRRTVKAQKRRDGYYFNSLRADEGVPSVTISPSVRYPNYQSMPRNYGRSNSSQNLKGETTDSPQYKGSRLSLYSNPEDREEIFRLRKNVENCTNKINQLEEQVKSKERQLEQNQTVLTAFEQQLQKFRISSPPAQTPPTQSPKMGDNGENEKNLNSAPLSPTPVNVRSCGSLTSISSHTSATSGSSNNSEEQKKKEQNRRNWLRDSFRSAFGRSNGKLGNKYPSTSRSACGDSSLCIIDDTESSNQIENNESVEELRTHLKEKDARLRESDRRLTDIRLAALSYQHEMDQLREEIQTLREERDTLRNSSTSLGANRTSSTFNGTMNSSLTKLTSEDSDDNKIVVFLETFDTVKKIIGHVNLESAEVNIDEEIKEVLQEYLKHIDDRSLGLSSQSITNTEVSAGCACVQVSFSAAVSLNEAMPLSKANQLFEASIETRRILIAGGAAHVKQEMAQRLAQILACQELELNRVADIPEHAIKTAGCLRELDDFSRLFDPTSDEPEAEQKRPLILIINLCLVNQSELVKTLRGRCKTPIVIAIGRDNEITPDCAETFQIFHLSCSGFDLGLKLRQKYVDYAMMNGFELRVRRVVQTQIKFLEMLHDKINQMLVTYQNANTKLGPEWYMNCPWSPAEFQSWFIRLWNHRLKPFLQANIIEGVKLYGDKGHEWFDIVPWIKNNFAWSNDEMFESMTAADVGLTRLETDPLLLMLQRLEAASKITTSESESTELDYSLPTPIY